MDKIKVVIYGLGGVGKDLVHTLSRSERIELVGAIARNPAIIGQDVGLYSGLEEPMGILVTDDKRKEIDLYEKQRIDVVLDCTSAKDAISTYQGMRSTVQHGINVIVASASITDLWSTNPELAKQIDEDCKKSGATLFGIGSVQVLERIIVALTEGSTNIDRVEFTHFADVHAFPEKSSTLMLGLGLTETEYYEKFENPANKGEQNVSMREASVEYISSYLGWSVNRVTRELKLMLDDNGIVTGTHEIIAGYEQGVPRMVQHWVFAYDPEKRYYDQVKIMGTPMVDVTMNFSPDRGMCTTAGTLKNAIRQIVRMQPGYISDLEVPFCSWSKKY